MKDLTQILKGIAATYEPNIKAKPLSISAAQQEIEALILEARIDEGEVALNIRPRDGVKGLRRFIAARVQIHKNRISELKGKKS